MTEITQGHVSKAKVKPSGASLLISPIRGAFWRHPVLTAMAAHHRSSSTSDLTCCQSRSPMPASAVQTSSTRPPSWECLVWRWASRGRGGGVTRRAQKLPAVLGCGQGMPHQRPFVTAYSRAAWDLKSQFYRSGPNHFHHSFRCRLDWYKEKDGSEKKLLWQAN